MNRQGFKRRIGLAAGLVGVALLSAAATARVLLGSRLVAAPDLIGARPAEAYAAASRLGLRLAIDGRRHDPSVAEGHVCTQDPPPGASIKNSRALRVSVSLGPTRITVPVVVGRSLREARLALEHAALGTFRVVATEDVTPAETVVLQDPPPGEVPRRDTLAVTLLVSRGPASADYVMPDLIGRPAEATLRALQQAGLRTAGVVYRSYPGAPPGIILKQAPAAGFRVTPRTVVAVEVSGSSS